MTATTALSVTSPEPRSRTPSNRRDKIERRIAKHDPMLSREAFCLSEFGLKQLKHQPTHAMRMTGKHFAETRQFYRTEIAGQRYYADKITGSLYFCNGLSAGGSPLRIRHA